MDVKELITRYKEKLVFLKNKLKEEYEELVKKNETITKLRSLFDIYRGNDYSKIVMQLPTEEIVQYANLVGVRCTLEEVSKYRYIVSENAFKDSYRSKEAKGYFENIALKLRNESLKRIKSDREEYLKDTLEYLEYLIKRVGNGRIKGSVDNIDKAIDLFDSTPLNGFTDAEKKELIKQLVLSDLNNLVKESSNISERLFGKEFKEDVVSLEPVEEVKEETVSEDTPVKEEIPVQEESTDEVIEEIAEPVVEPIEEPVIEVEPPKKYRTYISQEKVVLLDKIGLYADGIIDSYPPKTPTHEEYLNNIVPQIISHEITIEMLRDVLVVDKQYAYVLAVYLRDLVLSINDFLNTEEEQDAEVVNDLFDEQMVEVNSVYLVLKEIIEKISKSYSETEEELSELPEDGKFKLLFVRNGLESYFSKSLFNLRAYENIGNVEKILEDLENGNFANDRKIKNFKYKTKGSFAVFYRVKVGHILVFSIVLVRDLSTKKTDSMLMMSDSVNEIRLIRERTPEYDRLIEDSERERDSLRVMLGVAASGVQL